MSVGSEGAIRDSMALLERMMAQQPEALLGALEPGDREIVIAELRELANRAARVRAEADLLEVAGAVQRLVRGTPAWATLLLPKKRKVRKVTPAYDKKVHEIYLQDPSQIAQERAAQIRNHVVKTRERLERALREAPPERRG